MQVARTGFQLNPEKGMAYPEYHSVKAGTITACQVCNSPRIRLVLDLGHQPLCDNLLSAEALNAPETTYPLRMFWCQDCTNVQVDYCVPGETVYHADYPYKSGVTKELVEYQQTIADSLIERYQLTPSELVVDIGSNDGTLLQAFKSAGVKVLGIEPTNIAQLANDAGIETEQAFFDIRLSDHLKAKYGSASLIVTTNTFAHMQTIGEVIAGAHNLLVDGGVFVSETHYLLDVIRGGQFDTIYHEHLRTYSLRSLVKLFEPYDFVVTDVERGDRYGGNIRIHATKGRDGSPTERVRQLLAAEREFGLDKWQTYERFAHRAKAARLQFMEFLIQTKKAGISIVGNSCPGRSVTLLNYYGVNSDLLPYLAEQPASLKLGLFLPGKHIPVVNNQQLLDDQPDYVVLLAWHYAGPIMRQLKERGLRSDFVIPLPDFTIVRNADC